MSCVTCNGSTWVLASTSDGNKLTPCYTCKHAGRPQKPKPPHVIQKLPERFQKLIYAAETNTLGSITLSPGRMLNTADKAVLEYAARYALTGSQNCIERLDEILTAINSSEGKKPKRAPKVYDVHGLVFRPCRSCRTPIAFVVTEAGKRMPVEVSGVPHWGSCSDTKAWKGAA